MSSGSWQRRAPARGGRYIRRGGGPGWSRVARKSDGWRIRHGGNSRVEIRKLAAGSSSLLGRQWWRYIGSGGTDGQVRVKNRIRNQETAVNGAKLLALIWKCSTAFRATF